MYKVVYGETTYDTLFEIVDSLDELLKEVIAENEKLKDAIRNHTNSCEICKGYDEKSPNYGYTEFCEDCFWYPWADEEKCPNKWELKE